MRLIKLIKWTFAISLIGLLMGCEKSSELVLEQDALVDLLMPEVVHQPREADGVFRIWTYDKEVVPNLVTLNASYKDVEVEVVVKEDYIYNYVQSLAKGDAPDMMIINHKDFGSFNDLNAFMDLTEEEAIIKAMALDKASSRFNYGKARNQEQLLGILVGLEPWSFYYRADVLEGMGYDDDPKVLGEQLQDPEFYMNLMLQLKEEDRYIWMWPDEMLLIHLAQMRFHNAQYQLDLNQGNYEAVYEIAKRIQNERLFSGESIYDTGGGKAIEEKRIVGGFFSTWGHYFLKDFFPNTYGKWKVTQMPIGINQMDGSMVLIHKDTAYKEIALQIIVDWVKADIGNLRYLAQEVNLFMSKQKVGEVFQDAIEQYQIVFHTADDAWIQSIYDKAICEGITLGWDYDEVLAQVNRRIGEGRTQEGE